MTQNAATGSVRWEADATAAGLMWGSAILRITTKAGAQSYFVRRLGGQVGPCREVELTALGSGKSYDLELGAGKCSCGDATYRSRPGGCKHQMALRVALTRVAG
jgi:hypothetical protein